MSVLEERTKQPEHSRGAPCATVCLPRAERGSCNRARPVKPPSDGMTGSYLATDSRSLTLALALDWWPLAKPLSQALTMTG